jgi:hypothetical protein
MYETLVLQQGVPWLDSDFNEQVDLLSLRRMTENRARYGSCLMPATPGGDRGFETTSIAATISNANISAGYASVYGTIVPSTPDQVPSSFQYESDDNYMTNGTVSSVSGGDTITSDDKKFEGWMSLVGCRIKMTSGPESGNEFEITSVPNETSLTCSGGIGAVAATNTYIIKPPALPASVGSSTFKEFQLWVFWEWVNSNQDPNIVNPGVAMETSERRVLRWCVRAEDTPYAGTPDVWTFSLRIFPIASTTIETSDTELDIDLDPDIFSDPTLVWTKKTTQTMMHSVTMSGATITLPYSQGPDGLYKYYVGTGTTKESYRGFFELLDGSDPEFLRPLTGSDGEPITLDVIKMNNLTPVTDPSTQADSDGFIDLGGTTVLALDFSETVDVAYFEDVVVRCHYRANFTGLTTADKPEIGATRGMFDDKIFTRGYEGYDVDTGIDVDLLAKSLEGKIADIGAQLLARAPVEPSAQSLASDQWYLLNATGNVNSAEQARVEEYWNRKGARVLCQGCYPYTLSPITTFKVKAPSGTNLTASVQGWIYDDDGDHLVYINATAYGVSDGDVLNPKDRTDWNYYDFRGYSANVHQDWRDRWWYTRHEFFDRIDFNDDVWMDDNMSFGSAFTGLFDRRTPSSTRKLIYEWNGTSFGSIRLYLKGESSSLHTCFFEIAMNCVWEEGTSQWAFAQEGLPDEAGSATLFRFRSEGLAVFYQDESNVSGSRWDDNITSSAGWYSGVYPHLFGLSGNTGPYAVGRGIEYIRVSAHGKNYSASATTVYSLESYQFNNSSQGEATDAGTVITRLEDSSINWDIDPSVSSIDSRGFVFAGYSNSIASGLTANWIGSVNFSFAAPG